MSTGTTMFMTVMKKSCATVLSPDSFHRDIWKLFPGRKEAKRDFLFRADKLPGGLYNITMQSRHRPQTEKQDEFYVEVVKEYSPEFVKGGLYQFDIRVSPQLSKRNSEGKRVLQRIYKSEQQIDWLKKHLERPTINSSYASEPVCKIVQMDVIQNTEASFKSRKNEIAYPVVDFTGILQVLEPDDFKKMYLNGIGRQKVYGCGMLLLARLG